MRVCMWSAPVQGANGAAQAQAACASRAYEIEKGFVRETPLTYVVALSGNTAKDVTQRYAAHMYHTALLLQLSHCTDPLRMAIRPFPSDLHNTSPPWGMMQPHEGR